MDQAQGTVDRDEREETASNTESTAYGVVKLMTYIGIACTPLHATAVTAIFMGVDGR
jgi:hypothetical protein